MTTALNEIVKHDSNRICWACAKPAFVHISLDGKETFICKGCFETHMPQEAEDLVKMPNLEVMMFLVEGDKKMTVRKLGAI